MAAPLWWLDIFYCNSQPSSHIRMQLTEKIIPTKFKCCRHWHLEGRQSSMPLRWKPLQRKRLPHSFLRQMSSAPAWQMSWQRRNCSPASQQARGSYRCIAWTGWPHKTLLEERVVLLVCIFHEAMPRTAFVKLFKVHRYKRLKYLYMEGKLALRDSR